MPAEVTSDLQRVIEGRNPSQVTVLIEGVPGEGGGIADTLSDMGIESNRLRVQNKPIFEATVSPAQIDQLQQAQNILRIDYSGTFQPLSVARSEQPGFRALEAPSANRTDLYTVTERLGAPEAWEEIGSRGEGVRVGMIDSPIDTGHPTIRENIADTQDNTGGETHGTWIAGAICASDTETRKGRVRGVAPDVDLYSYGALRGGAASAGTIIEGIEWCIDQGCDIVNLSLGGPHSAVLESVVDDARQAGVLPIVSSGNSGPAGGTVTCPAHHDAAVAVGSVNLEGQIAAFSSRGPGWVDAPTKPEMTAYGGASIVAEPNQQIIESVLGPAANGDYQFLVGTSMASPQAAGAAALRVAATRGE